MPPLKDYYKILELEPSATLPEIRKAYRRLAQLHHPDKNQQDPYATARFTEIKEAYEVLTNPSKKEYYLQQRWYSQSMGKKASGEIITPVMVLTRSLELERYVSKLDVFRMDKEGLQQYILDLVPDDTISKLHAFNEPGTLREVITVIIRSLKPLPPAYAEPVLHQLEKLGHPDSISLFHIKNFRDRHQAKHRREKYSLLAIIIITAALCLLIYFAGR